MMLQIIEANFIFLGLVCGLALLVFSYEEYKEKKRG